MPLPPLLPTSLLPTSTLPTSPSSLVRCNFPLQSPVSQGQQSSSDLVFPYATCPLSNKCSDGPYLLYPLTARMLNFTPGGTPAFPIGGDRPVPETGEAGKEEEERERMAMCMYVCVGGEGRELMHALYPPPSFSSFLSIPRAEPMLEMCYRVRVRSCINIASPCCRLLRASWDKVVFQTSESHARHLLMNCPRGIELELLHHAKTVRDLPLPASLSCLTGLRCSNSIVDVSINNVSYWATLNPWTRPGGEDGPSFHVMFDRFPKAGEMKED
jgi:hypothetical protein